MKPKTLGMLFGLLSIITVAGVAPAFGQIDSSGNIVNANMEYTAKASDGTTVVITTTAFTSGQPLVLGIEFNDSNGNFVKHQNYAITVIQDNNTILLNPHAHTHTGMDIQVTQNLLSTDQINIQMTLLGVGLPTTDPSTWTGVKGEVLSFSQVALINTTIPEFGPVASIILAIAVLSVVVFAAKTRVIPRF
ncbi:MAG: PEFG-CTERM sorting domain-containing protein [Nitrosotalea sp.]